MPALIRGGFTLPELVVALTLLGLISAAALGLLRQTRDAYRAESQGIDGRQNLRIAAAFLPAELRELDATDGDLVAITDTAITIRAPRQFAVACRTPGSSGSGGALTLTLRDAPLYGLRDFNPTIDSLWVYSEAIADSAGDGGWMLGSIASVAPDSCPDGRPGRRVTTVFSPRVGPVTPERMIPSGAPVLGFETLTYRLYRATEDRRWYVGMKTATDLQPLLGPVTSDGLAFAYFDSSGAVTTDPTRVSLIEIRVRTEAVQPVRRAGRLERQVDSLVTLVALRNNRRF
ncbi:MAG TPA: prepilin-type N-terminal cleavage/methylation domain-containing protein [Gemmatimonadales bacterium]|jgi:prepilin-type N-terminal cleavage/methylation domain-containing protein